MKAIFFSGGYDSTYLLNKLMKEEKSVLVFSIISNALPRGKVPREKLAREKILNYLKAKYYNCKVKYCEMIVDFTNFDIINMEGLSQPLVWIPQMMLGCPPNEDIDLELSYIAGDQALGHRENFINIAKNVSEFRSSNININFPLIYIEKYEILKFLLEEDKFLFENATSCENYQEEDFCGNCLSCQHLITAIIQLYSISCEDNKKYLKNFLNDKFKIDFTLKRIDKPSFEGKAVADEYEDNTLIIDN